MGMSVSVATVGLLAPIALSFLLLVFPFGGDGGGRPTALAGFSAGAALCSTSLGTTFAILSSVGMQRTRAGTILVGAAMMDDVVGLVSCFPNLMRFPFDFLAVYKTHLQPR